jgi:DNA-binding CsgD family transcriptional regulator
MFDTIERAAAPTKDCTVGLRCARYPDLTLYLGVPRERHAQKFALRNPKEEIRYVEASNATFFVDPKGISNALMMGLVWGALGMTVEKTASDFDVAESTAKTQRATLYKKLGTSTMAHAVRVAFDESIFTPTSANDHPDLDITPRDLEILNALSLGNSMEQAGKQLYVSAATVKTHTYKIFSRNNVDNCAHAVMMAHLAGQLPLAT